MTGTLLNAIGILIGSLLGLILSRQFSAPTQLFWRGIMGVLTVVLGLHMTWTGLTGGGLTPLRALIALVAALFAGRFIGRLCHIQKGLNRLGKFASRRFTEVRPDDPNRFNEGFVVCAVLFCAGPLGIIGSVQDGLTGEWEPLGVKMVMDGLAAMGFACVYGGGVALSALPVFVYQGTITLLVHGLAPVLEENHLTNSVTATAGMLVFCVALVILELKKIELGDYLPSLVTAPLIAWAMRTYWH